MILVDANVFMYAAGAASPYKDPSGRYLFPLVLPVTEHILDRARDLLDIYPHLMARDALHAAVVLSNELQGICSYDRDFDPVRGMERSQPA